MKSSPGFRYFVGASLMAAVFVAMSSSTAQALPITYTAVVNGAERGSAERIAGTGFATVVYDDALHTMSVDASFTGFSGTDHGIPHPRRNDCGRSGTAGVATHDSDVYLAFRRG